MRWERRGGNSLELVPIKKRTRLDDLRERFGDWLVGKVIGFDDGLSERVTGPFWSAAFSHQDTARFLAGDPEEIVPLAVENIRDKANPS